DDARDRHLGQRCILQKMVDARAKRKNRLQIGERREQPGGLLPHADVIYVLRVPSFRPEPYFALARERTKAREPSFRLPTLDREQDRRHGYCATAPIGAVSRLNAAANNARV